MYSPQNTTTLAAIAKQFNLTLVTDAAFYAVGKIPADDIPSRLVPCNSATYCSALTDAKNIAAVIAPPELKDQIPTQYGLILSPSPVETAYAIHEYLNRLENYYWQDFDSEIDPNAFIAPGVQIPEKNVRIGAHTKILPHSFIGERTIIGEHCTIGPSAVIGGNPFEVYKAEAGRKTITASGGVNIGNYVTIQSLSNVDKPAFSCFTEIGDNSSVDSLVHIAHDCKIGSYVTITACAEISGRVKIGDHAYLGPNCSISNGLTIGNHAKISIGAVVTKSVGAKETMSGNFAVPHQTWLSFIRNLVKTPATT